MLTPSVDAECWRHLRQMLTPSVDAHALLEHALRAMEKLKSGCLGNLRPMFSTFPGVLAIFLLAQFWNAGVHHGASQKLPHAKLNANISQTSAWTNTRLRASKLGTPSTFHLVKITPTPKTYTKTLFLRLTDGGNKTAQSKKPSQTSSPLYGFLDSWLRL